MRGRGSAGRGADKNAHTVGPPVSAPADVSGARMSHLPPTPLAPVPVIAAEDEEVLATVLAKQSELRRQ